MRYFIIVLALALAWQVSAQMDFSVTGRVLDENEKPLPGANIYLPELHRGTISDSSGYFTLSELPSGIFPVRVSYLSYETAIFSLDTDHQSDPFIIHLHPSPIQGKAVVISGGTYSSQHHNAIKIEALSRKEIFAEGSSTLAESISQTPGVDMISRGGGMNTPVIRGLSTSNILFLNNGVRLENYQFSSDHPYLADEYGVSQIEIIKGPASLLFGSDAIGGVINTIPESPAAINSFEGDFGGQYFSNTNGYAGSLGLKSTKGKFSWGLRGGLKSHEDYTAGDGQFVPNTRFNTQSAKAFSSYRKGKAIFRLYYDYQKMKVGVPNEESIPLITENSRTNDVWFQDLNSHLLMSRNNFFLGHSKLAVNLAYQNNHRILRGDEAEDGHQLVDMRLQTFNYELREVYTLSSETIFTLAAQGMVQENKNGEAPNRVLPDYTLNDIAIFAMAQHNVKERLHFQLGVRFDNRFLFTPEQEKSAHSHDDEHEGEEEHQEDEHEEEMMEPLSRYYGNLSASAGLTYDLTEEFLVRFNLASAYRAPNIAELTQDGEHGVRYEKGDRDLVPQRNYEADLSAHYHSRFLMVDASVFYNHINNYIFLDYTSDTTDEGLNIYAYRQSNAVLYGGELSLELMPWEVLSISGSYAYLHGEQENGNYLPFIPQNKLKAHLKFEKEGSNWLRNYFLWLGVEYAFSQNNAAPDETQSPEYTLLNASVGITIPINDWPVELSLTATNLLDEQYIDHLSTLKDLGYNNMGRNIVLNLRIPFGW